MDYNSRKILIDFLNKSERKYSVGNWQVKGIDFWPILKVQLFFSIFKEEKTVSKKIKYLFLINKIISKVIFVLSKYNLPKSYYMMKKVKIQKSDIAFSAPVTTRVKWNDSSFSRYFDPIMDDLQKNGIKSTHYDYLKIDHDTCYKKERVIDVTDIYPYFHFKYGKSVLLNPSGQSGLEDFLKEVNVKYKLREAEVIKKLAAAVAEINVWKELWKYVFTIQKSKKCLCICYYNNPMFGLCLAGKELDIVTVDMQHGGQGYLHPAYYYTDIKQGGYNTLPNFFWTWDIAALNSLEEWLPADKSHKAILGGNPWIDYLLAENIDKYISDRRKMILLTLQVGFTPLISDFIINAMKTTSSDYVWWVRLHPRMASEEIAQLNERLIKEGLQDKIEIKLATELPLPILLNNCIAHLSSYSGSISEAAMMGVTNNIILHEIGKSIYSKLIDDNLAVYFDSATNNDLFTFIKENETKNHMRNTAMENKKRDYKKIINELG